MRSFLGRDILSLKDFERDEYFELFQVADELAHYAEKRRGTATFCRRRRCSPRSSSRAHAPVSPRRPPCTGWGGTCSASPTPR